MTPLQRPAILTCTAVVAMVLSVALLVRGGSGDGRFHTVVAEVTPTVEMEGVPAPDFRAAAAELADLDGLARATLVLFLMAAATALVSLLGVIAAETLLLEGRRVVEVMLGAPLRGMLGGTVRRWRRRLLWSLAAGGAVAAGIAALMAALAPPGISFAAPSWMTGLGALLILAGLLALAALVPIRTLYSPSRPLVQEAESQQLTDPRPRRFNRVLMITGQLAVAVTIVTASGLFLLSGGGAESGGVSGTGGRGGDGGHTVLGLLSPTEDARGDPFARAALYESALAGLQRTPEVVAESLATPGAWIGRGPEVRTANECGRCSDGGMPHPIHVAIVKHHAVMPGFFAERGLPLVAGRGFSTEGPGTGAREVVINLAYARDHFLEPPVIGRQVALGGIRGEWHVVVGIVRDIGGRGLGASGSPYSVYLSALDHPPARIELVASVPAGVAEDEEDSLRIVRESLAGLPGSGLAVGELRPAADEVERMHGTAVWLGQGSRGAGVVATLAAVFGMVGAMRTHVRSRLRDMGIRSALGAAPRALKRLILREALRIGGAGVGMGLWGTTLVVGVVGPPDVAIFNAPLFLAVGVLFLGVSVGAAVPGARLAATAEPREVMDA